MKRPLPLLFLLLVCAQFALANTVNTFNNVSASLSIFPNDGSGSNMAFSFSGQGISLSGVGGTGCSWCFGGDVFFAGQSMSGSISFLGFDFVSSGQIGNTHFGPGELSLGSSSITVGNFVFPSTTSGFTVSFPAAFDSTLFGAAIDGSQSFGLNIHSGVLKLTFDFLSACGTPGCYTFNHATFVTAPEPATILLFITGLALITGLVWRKRHCVGPGL